MQRKSAGHWQIERLAEDRIDHTAMTGNGDVSAGMGVDDAPYCGADASVKGRCRLASRKYLDVRISRPIRVFPKRKTYSSNVIPSISGPGSCSPKSGHRSISVRPIAGAMISAVSTARAKSLEIRTSAPSSSRSLKRSASCSDCRRPSVLNPEQVRYPPMTRCTVTLDSPWRISVIRVGLW